MKKTIITVVGPTAIGKSLLAMELALHFKTEIISADSRQFYREMNAGTAKPAAEELKKVKHHFINSLSIHEPYNVGQFEKDALGCLDHIFFEHDAAIVVGGSGLFIDVLCNGMDHLPESDLGLRNELNELLQQDGIRALQDKLSELDPEYFKTVDLSNPHRLIRAIEVCIVTGMKYSDFRKKEKKNRGFSIIKIGVDDERAVVYNRINMRVNEMMKAGLVEEATALYPFRHLNALKTVGYQELFEFLDNKITLDEAVELIKRNTRRYAKRQLTWFRRDEEIKWFTPGDKGGIFSSLRNSGLEI